MFRLSFKLALALLFVAQAAAFLNAGSRRAVTSLKASNICIDNFKPTNFMGAALVATTPAMALADSAGQQSAVLTPIIISFLTIIPFIYYAK
jgi:hypothetical protein